MPETTATDKTAVFGRERQRLLGLAYRMLGSWAEAEDAVQEAWLRWHRTEAAEIRSPAAWLTTAVTRICIDELRSARIAREQYVGTWLPEPVATEDAGPDGRIEMLDGLEVALLVVLERLAPAERAAFLLREVFDYGYDEIAAILGKSEAACRQLVSRARRRVNQDRPRFEVVPGEQERVFGVFVSAVESGDLAKLESLFAEDAALYSDHGGKAVAARNVVRGAERMSRFFAGLRRKMSSRHSVRPCRINGMPGLLGYEDGTLITALAFEVAEGRIRTAYAWRNPDKLRTLSQAN